MCSSYCEIQICCFKASYENKGKEEAQMKCAETRQRKHENAQGQA